MDKAALKSSEGNEFGSLLLLVCELKSTTVISCCTSLSSTLLVYNKGFLLTGLRVSSRRSQLCEAHRAPSGMLLYHACNDDSNLLMFGRCYSRPARHENNLRRVMTHSVSRWRYEYTLKLLSPSSASSPCSHPQIDINWSEGSWGVLSPRVQAPSDRLNVKFLFYSAHHMPGSRLWCVYCSCSLCDDSDNMI